MTTYSLKIADYTIFFNAMTPGISLRPSASQQSFISDNEHFDLAINVFTGPVVVREEATAVFRAPYVEEIDGRMVKKSDEFWTVYRLGDYILVRTSCPVSPSCKEALLVIRPGEKSWDLVMDSPARVVNPMCYPVDGLILYYLTALKGDIFIHGSGISHKGRGCLFTGRSGRGKTTIAGIFSDSGSQVVHDDRLVIRQNDQGVFMYNTPVYDNEEYSKAALSSIYIIDHGQRNESRSLSPSDAVSSVMSNCIQHHWDSGLINNLAGSIIQLIDRVKVKKLKFVPDSTLVSFIEKDEH